MVHLVIQLLHKTCLSFVVDALDVGDLALYGGGGDAVWHIDVVPHAQLLSRLSHYHVTPGHPLQGWEQVSTI